MRHRFHTHILPEAHTNQSRTIVVGGERGKRRPLKSRAVGRKSKELVDGRANHPDQFAGKDGAQEPIVILEIDIGPETDDDSTATLQVRFEPGDFALGQSRYIA